MTQHGFQQMGGGGSIDPNDLNMNGNYTGQSYQGGFNAQNQSYSTGYTSGSGQIQDDELLDSLTSPTDTGMHGNMGMDMTSMSGYPPQTYATSHGLPMGQSHMNGYSSTPDGDPIQSPFVHSLHDYHRSMHSQPFGSLQSPGSFAGSPIPEEPSYLTANARMSQAMQRKPSNTRSPLTKNSMMNAGGIPGSVDSFGAQPIRTNGASHEKSSSGQWIQTPNSLQSFPGSGFASPLQPGFQNAQINEMLMKGGASMPAKLGSPMTNSQEAKKKRRRESHNLVERRRRDNINERIQDLSRLVPTHRLEDEKIKKMIASGTPMSPTLTGLGTPSQATSGLAGPGARRAASVSTGNITTGLPMEDKDKGPNKGDILNGAVYWMRDLMWLTNILVERQQEIAEHYAERNEPLPWNETNDEQRMVSELISAVQGAGHLVYTRTNGTGLRVPDFTDYKGDPTPGSDLDLPSVSPDDGSGVLVSDMLDQDHMWEHDDGSGDMELKEEDEFMNY